MVVAKSSQPPHEPARSDFRRTSAWFLVSLRLAVAWSNAGYLVAALVGVSVMLGISSGWPRAHLKVVPFVLLPAVTGMLNVISMRRRRWAATSGWAVALNCICLGLLVAKPEFSNWVAAAATWSVPVANVIALVADRGGRHDSRTAAGLAAGSAPAPPGA